MLIFASNLLQFTQKPRILQGTRKSNLRNQLKHYLWHNCQLSPWPKKICLPSTAGVLRYGLV